MSEAQRYVGLAWVAALAIFMQTLDATILNTALPSIAKSLHDSPLNLQWTIIGYALTVALFIPLSGWLADRYGTLKIFQFAIVIFCIGSLSSALSTSLMALIISRIVQGIGGALLMPTARLALIRTVPQKDLLKVWNLTAMSGLIGPILGPILGGILVTYASWHWIFLINIPIGILGIVMSQRYLPNLKGVERPLDSLGLVLFAGGLFCLTFGLDAIGHANIARIWATLIVLFSIILFWFYVVYAKKNRNPILDITLFHGRIFSLGMSASMFVRLSSAGIPYLLPLFLQVVLGRSAEISGWVLAPTALGAVLVKPFVSPLINRFGYKNILLVNCAVMMLVMFSLGWMSAQWSLYVLAGLLFIYGMAISTMYGSLNALTVGDIKKEKASDGSTLLSVMQQVGLGVGIAVASVVLDLFRSYLGEDQLLHAFHYTIWAMALLGFVAIYLMSQLKSTDGDNMRKSKSL